jgi:hypothetical protein
LHSVLLEDHLDFQVDARATSDPRSGPEDAPTQRGERLGGGGDIAVTTRLLTGC